MAGAGTHRRFTRRVVSHLGFQSILRILHGLDAARLGIPGDRPIVWLALERHKVLRTQLEAARAARGGELLRPLVLAAMGQSESAAQPELHTLLRHVWPIGHVAAMQRAARCITSIRRSPRTSVVTW